MPAGVALSMAVALAGDQIVGIVGGEEVATGAGTPEMPVQHAHPGPGAVQIAGLARRLVHREGGAGHGRVIVQHGRLAEFVHPVAVPEAVALGHPVGDEIERQDRRVAPFRPVEDLGGGDEGRNHQAVPVGQHLVVPAGPDSRVRVAFNTARSAASAASSSASPSPRRRERLRMTLPSQLPRAETS